jgi:hypothetical protein
MATLSSQLTGTAGEHFVVYQLSCLRFIAALPRAGAKGVDVLVTNEDGSKSLTLQVKTTGSAIRHLKSRTEELQFPLGDSWKLNSRNLFFTFVDLRVSSTLVKQPDVYIIPSKIVHGWCKSWAEKKRLVRLHKPVDEMEPYKNNWQQLISRLDPNRK